MKGEEDEEGTMTLLGRLIVLGNGKEPSRLCDVAGLERIREGDGCGDEVELKATVIH